MLKKEKKYIYFSRSSKNILEYKENDSYTQIKEKKSNELFYTSSTRNAEISFSV